MLSSVKKFVSKYLVQDSQTVATSSNESTEPKPLQSTNPDEDQWNDQEEHESKKRPLNIEEDRHDSEERPTKRHATEEISTEDNKQQKKEGEFYFCPFKGCSQVYMWRASIVKHIQKTHFKIPRLNTDHCVLQTRSGHIIDFNESSRETVNEGEELIMTSRALRKWERKVTESPDKQDKYFYCPYKGCNLVFMHRWYTHSHIREKHCPELPILENNPKAWLHNSLGEIINTSDVNCRNTLDSDQKVTLKEQPKHYNRLQGQNMDRESFHCPYKSCRFVITDSPQSMENGLQHIRRDHFFEFPVTIGTKYPPVFVTKSGKVLRFGEHSSNVLDQGDKIFIKYLIPAKDAQCDTQYCPYQTCKYTTKCGYINTHIRKNHDSFFFIPRVTGSLATPVITVFQDSSGRQIFFGEESRNLLKKNERIIVSKFKIYEE